MNTTTNANHYNSTSYFVKNIDTITLVILAVFVAYFFGSTFSAKEGIAQQTIFKTKVVKLQDEVGAQKYTITQYKIIVQKLQQEKAKTEDRLANALIDNVALTTRVTKLNYENAKLLASVKPLQENNIEVHLENVKLVKRVNNVEAAYSNALIKEPTVKLAVKSFWNTHVQASK